MGTYYTSYSEFPDSYLTDWLEDYVSEWNGEFRDYWGLDAEQPPKDLEQGTWQVLRIWDRLAGTLFESAKDLRDQSDGEIERFLALFRELDYDPTDELFFRQLFELELARGFARDVLPMADRALELVDLLVSVEGERVHSYLRRVADCYIRGLRTETVVMCGAVLEAALEHYAPDELVREEFDFLKGRRHVLAGHRLQFVREEGLLSEQTADTARSLLDDRNQAIHVSPGLETSPKDQVSRLAEVLQALEPPEWLDDGERSW